MSKEYLIIHSLDKVEEIVVDNYNEAIRKLINQVPLQYITNKQEFMKLDFYVDENVLIPRADTEILVEEVIEYCNKESKKEYRILDLCSGSGAIGISIAKYVPNAKVVCADISDKALEVSKKNAKINEVDNINFIQTNMFENIEDEFDIIVSNPPYIKTEVIKTLDKEVQKEPHIALDGGETGLDFYEIIVQNAYKYLQKDGSLFLEIGYDQKDEVEELLHKNENYREIYSKKDLAGNDRIVVAKV